MFTHSIGSIRSSLTHYIHPTVVKKGIRSYSTSSIRRLDHSSTESNTVSPGYIMSIPDIRNASIDHHLYRVDNAVKTAPLHQIKSLCLGPGLIKCVLKNGNSISYSPEYNSLCFGTALLSSVRMLGMSEAIKAKFFIEDLRPVIIGADIHPNILNLGMPSSMVLHDIRNENKVLQSTGRLIGEVEHFEDPLSSKRITGLNYDLYDVSSLVSVAIKHGIQKLDVSTELSKINSQFFSIFAHRVVNPAIINRYRYELQHGQCIPKSIGELGAMELELVIKLLNRLEKQGVLYMTRHDLISIIDPDILPLYATKATCDHSRYYKRCEELMSLEITNPPSQGYDPEIGTSLTVASQILLNQLTELGHIPPMSVSLHPDSQDVVIKNEQV